MNIDEKDWMTFTQSRVWLGLSCSALSDQLKKLPMAYSVDFKIDRNGRLRFRTDVIRKIKAYLRATNVPTPF